MLHNLAILIQQNTYHASSESLKVYIITLKQCSNGNLNNLESLQTEMQELFNRVDVHTPHAGCTLRADMTACLMSI